MYIVATDTRQNVNTRQEADKIAADYVYATYSPAEIIRSVTYKGKAKTLVERYNMLENGKIAITSHLYPKSY